MFTRRNLLAGATALGGASLLPGLALAKGGLVATTYPGTWEDAYRAIVVPLLKKKDDIDLELAPLFAMDQVGKAKASRGAPPFDVFVLDPGPRIVAIEGGIFDKFDGKKLTNLAKVPDGFADDWGVCVSAQVVGIAYNPKKLPPPKGWKDLLTDPWVSRLGLTGFQTTFGTSSIIEISKQFGGSLTNVEPGLAELKKVLPKIAAVGLPAAMPGLFQQGQCDVMYTNTQTVATLKGKGIDIEFVKPEVGLDRLLHHHAHRQGHGRDGQRLQVSRPGGRQGGAGGADQAALQLRAGQQGRAAAAGPADEEPRRDDQVREPRLGADQPAARGLDREVQQGHGEVTMREAPSPAGARSARRDRERARQTPPSRSASSGRTRSRSASGSSRCRWRSPSRRCSWRRCCCWSA